jgi:hypothetical protein
LSQAFAITLAAMAPAESVTPPRDKPCCLLIFCPS